MRQAIHLALILLAVLHHDFWWWSDPALVLGFLPISLAYHMLYCLVVAGVWYLALQHAWPEDAERLAEITDADEVRPK